MTTLLQDIRYALRQLRKSPGFTAIAVISLALAIGANTTIFSYANQMLYRRLGVPHPEQLRNLVVYGDKHVAIHASWGSSTEDPGGGFRTSSFTFPVYQQLRKQNTSLQDIFAYKQLHSVNATANGTAQAIKAELVSGNLYTQMQVQPQLGRVILPTDDSTPGTGTVAILSDAFWHHTFGGSPDVLGKTITINNTPFTIIGVNPPGFTGPERASSASAELFLPLSMISVLHPGSKATDPLGPEFWWLQLMARAKPGVSDTQATAALDVAINAAVRSTMTLKKDETVPHVSLNDGSRGNSSSQAYFAKPLYLLLGFSGLVLLLACTNIANLMLSRATLRQREMSVRMALGAGRIRILRQVLTESVLLSVLGGIAGLFLGYLGRNLIPWLTSNAWEGGDLSVPFDWRVFAFTSAITLATGILFGIAPAWRSTRTSINTALKEGSRSATRSRRAWSGKAIVGFQVALSTMLVLSAAFFIRTIINLNAVNPGFNTDHVYLVDVDPPAKQYPSPKDVALDHRLEDAFAAIPGVQSATLADIPLVADSMSNSGFVLEGQQKSSIPNEDQVSYLDDVGSGFFSTMQIPILAGRSFNSQDTETSARVSIINQALARKFFPNANPIGKRFLMGTSPDAKPIQIIGIAADTCYADLRDVSPPIHFELYRQETDIGPITYIIRSPLNPARLIPALRNAAKQIDPDLPLTQIRTQQQQIDAVMQQERTFASLTAGFGFLALALACVGIYGIMAYTVSQRTNEIGIRLALGAARERVRAMVLRETAWLAAIGLVVGLGATLALAQLIKSMLYGLKPTDPLTLGVSVLLLLLVAFVAGWVPAYRASQVNPIDALRSE